jgi:hypothetical protein
MACSRPHAPNAILVSLLLCATFATAWAEVIPPEIPDGPAFLRNDDKDMSSLYEGDPGSYVGDQIDQLTRTPPIDAWDDMEDGWGIFRMSSILKGLIDPGTGVIYGDNDMPYYVASGNDVLLAGVFWGVEDVEVNLNADGSWEVFSEGLQFELWAVDSALTGGSNLPAWSDGARQAANRYPNWVDENDATKVLLASGTSTYLRFAGVIAGQFEGTSELYIDINENDPAGLWNEAWGTGAYYTDPDGNEADVYLSWDLHTGTSGWSTDSYDDGGVWIPEPLTLLLLLVGVPCLRRR